MEPNKSQEEQTPSATQALIKRLRARNLTQSEISRRTGIPQPRLSRWEGGDVAAGADDALKLQALEAELAQQAANDEPAAGDSGAVGVARTA